MAAYSEWDIVYKTVNKIKMYFSNKTVKFKTGLRLNFCNDYSLKDIEKLLFESFESSRFEIERGIFNMEQYKMYSFDLEQVPQGLVVKCRLDVQKEYLNIQFIFQISARDVKKAWHIAKELNNEISNKFAFQPTYSIVLDYSSSNLNPFYRLTIKSIDKTSSYNFDLKFSEDNVSIKIHNNELYAATNSDMNKLDKIIDEYISLSNAIQ